MTFRSASAGPTKRRVRAPGNPFAGTGPKFHLRLSSSRIIEGSANDPVRVTLSLKAPESPEENERLSQTIAEWLCRVLADHDTEQKKSKKRSDD